MKVKAKQEKLRLTEVTCMLVRQKISLKKYRTEYVTELWVNVELSTNGENLEK